MNVLRLTKCHHSSYPGGLYTPADNRAQEEALKHFSCGCIAITADRLDEIIFVAGLHGWEVCTEDSDSRHNVKHIRR
jgi:hypothetical protein